MAARPRYHVHFTPTSSSWLNQIERWFAEITRKRIHQCAYELAMILFKGLPQRFRNIQLLACPAVAQRRSKLIEDRIFDHASRHGFGGTRTPSVLPRRFTYIVAIIVPSFMRSTTSFTTKSGTRNHSRGLTGFLGSVGFGNQIGEARAGLARCVAGRAPNDLNDFSQARPIADRQRVIAPDPVEAFFRHAEGTSLDLASFSTRSLSRRDRYCGIPSMTSMRRRGMSTKICPLQPRLPCAFGEPVGARLDAG